MPTNLNKKIEQKSGESFQTARIHSIETMGLVDGPGIRTIFFLQGCPLRCAYCHNPDTQAFKGGIKMTANDILKTALRYKSYYGEEGGVTFSGGEPLAQGKFLAEVLPLLHEQGVNICLDTSGYGQQKYYKDILPYVDVLLLDIKAFNHFVFEQVVEAEISIFLNFINELEKNGFKGKIWLRHVMLPGLTNDELSMQSFVELAMPMVHLIDRIEILPYHTLGTEKYEELGREYRLKGMPPMDAAEAKQLEIYVNKRIAERFKTYRVNSHSFDASKEKTLLRNNNFQLATNLIKQIDKYGIKTDDTYELEFPEPYRNILINEIGLGKNELLRKIGEFKDLGYIDTPDNRTIILKDLKTLYNYQI